jgi:hypothetical protein
VNWKPQAAGIPARNLTCGPREDIKNAMSTSECYHNVQEDGYTAGRQAEPESHTSQAALRCRSTRARTVQPDFQLQPTPATEKTLRVGRRRKQLSVSRTLSSHTLTAADRRAAGRILAAIVARAFAADHPELFRRKDCGRTLSFGQEV